MEFCKDRVFTALNADELRAGDKVIVADCIADLKQFVIDQDVDELYEVDDESSEYRFIVEDGVGIVRYALAYLVERAENCTNCKYSNPHKNLLYCEDDNIPIYVGGEKLSVCDKYEPKTEQKAEKHYRPFRDTDELIKVFCEKTPKIYDKDDEKLFMPYIWVRNKNDRKVWLITEFDNRILDYLFTNCEFLDGSVCGVEE